MTYLLDANVVIAAAIRYHVHHDRAIDWLAEAGTVALCPVVEGSLVRFLVRTGEPAWSAAAAVSGWRSRPFVEWWPDDVSYADVDLGWVRGHRQVTDAYLLGLARHRSATLVTLDDRLARAHPDGIVLIP